MTKAAAIVAILILFSSSFPAKAQRPDFYLGGLGGYGSSRMHSLHDTDLTSRTYTAIERHPSSPFFGAYGGAGYGPLALEGGALSLPTYHAFAASDSPPRSAHQTITGWAYFARGVARVPPNWHWYIQPYAFLGAAHVYGQNHEEAVLACTACGPGYVPNWHNWTSKWTPYYGLGAEIPVYGEVSARVEFGWMPDAIMSNWTGDRDYALGSVSLQISF